MPNPPFVDHCAELFAPLGTVRTRRMFGGWGLYVDDLFIALVAAERLYLKSDAQTRPRFEAAGCEPAVFEADGKQVVMSYWTAPDDALESPALMQPWARLALQAAVAAQAAKSVKPPATKATSRAPSAARKRPRAG